MNQFLETESTLTDRYQTTIPETVRNILSLGKRDKLHYKIMSDGTVLLSRAEPVHGADPALAGFLALLANDLQSRPETISRLSKESVRRARALIADVDVDLDARLDPDDE